MFVVAELALSSYPVDMRTHDELMAEMIRQLDAGDLRPKQVAEALGIPSSRVAEMRRGARRIQPHEMSIVSKLLAIEDAQAPSGAIPVRLVPLVGRAPAGNWREAIEVPIGHIAVRKDKAGSNSFAVEIDGDSMNMILPEGGWAVIDPDQKHFYHKRVYLVMNGDGEATVKRYCDNPARLVPVSTNDTHGEIMLGEPVTIIGRVVSYGNDEGL